MKVKDIDKEKTYYRGGQFVEKWSGDELFYLLGDEPKDDITEYYIAETEIEAYKLLIKSLKKEIKRLENEN